MTTTPPPAATTPRHRGLMTPDEVATLLQVPPSRIKRMRLNGDGPAFIQYGRLFRYHPRDVQAWIEAHRCGG